MNTSTVNISFRKDLLRKIDEVAQNESRTRSELIREAARMYLERKSRWSSIFQYSESIAEKKQLTTADIDAEIKKIRSKKKERP